VTDFTELPDKWRDKEDEWCCIECRDMTIKELEAAIPKWKTLDPNDESTWPEDRKVYLVSTRGTEEFAEWQVSGFGFDVFACEGWIGINDCVIQYREKCSIDSPTGD